MKFNRYTLPEGKYRAEGAAKPLLLTVSSGLLMSAGFPPLSLSWISWFALIPFLVSLKYTSPGKGFLLGIVWGLSHFISLIYWIVWVVGYYGGLGTLVAIWPMILLCSYLSVFPGLFGAIAGPLSRRPYPAVSLSAIWVSLEYLRANVLTGFPWCLIGYSQGSYLSLIQIADVTGVYGLSFLVLMANLSLTGFLARGGSTGVLARSLETAFTAILIFSAMAYGHERLSRFQSGTGTPKVIKAALIQGNIDQSVKWEKSYQLSTIEKYISLSNKALANKPELIVWPETAVPFFLQEESELSQRVISAVKMGGVFLVTGSPAYRRSEAGLSYLNRAYLVKPEEGLSDYYDKVHLVPFGEYVPLKSVLSFVNRLVPAAGDFESGASLSLLDLKGLKAGTIICFEAIFPDISRKLIHNGADLLLNLTNDAWFGKTSAPYQHAAMARFRAIENRVPLLRAANTGFSMIVEATGEIIAAGDIFTEEIIEGEVAIGSYEKSFYTRFGDIFIFILIIFAILRVSCLMIRNRVNNQP